MCASNRAWDRAEVLKLNRFNYHNLQFTNRCPSRSSSQLTAGSRVPLFMNFSIQKRTFGIAPNMSSERGRQTTSTKEENGNLPVVIKLSIITQRRAERWSVYLKLNFNTSLLPRSTVAFTGWCFHCSGSRRVIGQLFRVLHNNRKL